MVKITAAKAAEWARGAINRQLTDRGAPANAVVRDYGSHAQVYAELPELGRTKIYEVTGTRTRQDQTRIELGAVKALRMVTGWMA